MAEEDVVRVAVVAVDGAVPTVVDVDAAGAKLSGAPVWYVSAARRRGVLFEIWLPETDDGLKVNAPGWRRVCDV